MPKKTIQVKEVVRDIKGSMHPNALMNKYELSPGQLKSLMKKLQEARLIEPPPADPPPGKPSVYEPIFTCPACGLTEQGELDECPRCGVVASKYHPPTETIGPSAPAGGKEAKVEFGTWSQSSPRSFQGLKILAAVAALLLAFGAIVTVKQYREAAQQESQRAAQEQTTGSEPGDANRADGAPPRYKDFIQQRLPRMGPINPEADALMRESMGQIGEMLDKRNKAREDLTNEP